MQKFSSSNGSGSGGGVGPGSYTFDPAIAPGVGAKVKIYLGCHGGTARLYVGEGAAPGVGGAEDLEVVTTRSFYEHTFASVDGLYIDIDTDDAAHSYSIDVLKV